jgi:hypothetical protein
VLFKSHRLFSPASTLHRLPLQALPCTGYKPVAVAFFGLRNWNSLAPAIEVRKNQQATVSNWAWSRFETGMTGGAMGIKPDLGRLRSGAGRDAIPAAAGEIGA